MGFGADIAGYAAQAGAVCQQYAGGAGLTLEPARAPRYLTAPARCQFGQPRFLAWADMNTISLTARISKDKAWTEEGAMMIYGAPEGADAMAIAEAARARTARRRPC